MIFIVFFVLAVVSLFGFGQIMGAREKEKNLATNLYERFGKDREGLKDRFESMRNKYSNTTHKPERYWFGLPKREKKLSLLDRLLGRK
jgi:hypothetical protein